ncbi:Pentatricopeptide repeat-containing protein [Apostasia shenzhenica]|uniref:Pentatricopeptide repeat-containing protein n=1 Tax=Apostasia shenzhenica TaxID=1088818 RepID=A0A2H9ZX08_9ASPA|nr:Pentatricopeptide repeat-containing protein [Apostasia shenzhenica]
MRLQLFHRRFPLSINAARRSSLAALCSLPIPNSEEHERSAGPGESLSLRVERLRGGEPAASAIRSWMGDGFAVHRGEVFHAINRLRKLGRNKRALEIMEWIMRERPYKLKALDYAYLLEFTAKIHGISQGESLFLRIPHEFQNELLYNNLVMACLDKGLVSLSLNYMRKMRELSLPISPYVYNRLIILHSSSGQRKTIPKILRQMKADCVLPHVSTYNILLKIEADEHNIEGLSKVFNEMKKMEVKPSETTYGILAIAHAVARLYTVSEMFVEEIEKIKTGKNWSTLDILLILYGYLGKQSELERTWKLVKSLPHVRAKSFLLAIESFGRMGCMDRAEEIWAEIKSSKSTKHFNSMISVYCRSRNLDKASDLFEEMQANGCKPNAITYRNLALGCLKSGLIKEGLRTLDLGEEKGVSFQVRRSTPWLETAHMLLEAFADIGDLRHAKILFKEFKETKYCRYSFVHNSLLRAHVKAKVCDPELLRKMILAGARPDAETYSLMRLAEEFKV